MTKQLLGFSVFRSLEFSVELFSFMLSSQRSTLYAFENPKYGTRNSKTLKPWNFNYLRTFQSNTNVVTVLRITE